MVLSRDALEKWLSQHCLEASILKQDPVTTDSRPPDSQDKRLPVVISIPDSLCEHGLLDPEKSKEMKCISKVRHLPLKKAPALINNIACFRSYTRDNQLCFRAFLESL